MKRTLVTATAAALLLAGCATGDTGHLDPDISPDLVGPRSTQPPEPPAGDPDAGTQPESGAGSAEGAVETPAPGTSAAPANDVEAAFAASSSGEAWYTDITAVDTDGDTVIVTTRLVAGDAFAVDACEAAVAAAQGTGVAQPVVDVRDVEGTTISERTADAEGCSS